MTSAPVSLPVATATTMTVRTITGTSRISQSMSSAAARLPQLASG